ncbi:beta-amyrin 28-oxidase-like [Dorcoceras hygrometricum]|uniref:Beta-amyrin 28-oxidase-like n=1 Tax=Dorcoceras hygrometricum TaxID=472368 RepID=A0A2Z7AY26_9LAMI|nr:beta-amyrin 28-oxidase-like [Dorcoceras hygrometricum]
MVAASGRTSHTARRATTFWSSRSFSLIRQPLPEPFRLDHPQVQEVLTRPTLAQTMDTTGRIKPGKQAHRARRLHTLHGVNLQANGSTLKSPLRTTTSHSLDHHEPLNIDPKPLKQSINRSNVKQFKTVRCTYEYMHDHEHEH